MLRKYSMLLAIIIATMFLVVAAKYYPDGAQYCKNSTGHDNKNNYLGKLFSNKAINQLDNPSRLCAIYSIFFLLDQ